MDERAITAHLVEAGYERIMSNGGDGTFVQVVNDVVDRVRAEIWRVRTILARLPADRASASRYGQRRRRFDGGEPPDVT